MTDTQNTTKGQCQCGAVRFEIEGPLRDIVNCHCTMCLKFHGGFGAYTQADKKNLTFTEEKGLNWYKTSDIARRGFCANCGSSLFWDPFDDESMGVAAGALEQPTGLKTIGHIYVSEKPDFYDITDSCPQFRKSSKGQLPGDH